MTFSTGSTCGAAFTHAYEIQGSGTTPAITGAVTTQGVVVGDYEGASPALRGFYLQDAAATATAATSDAMFVFEPSNADSVNLGDVVRVTGTAGENQGQTQVSAAGAIAEYCGTGTVAPTEVTLPVRVRGLPRAVRGHARDDAADALRHRALPARPLRPGADVVRRPAPAADQRRRARRRRRRPSRRPTTCTRSSSTTRRRPRTPTRSCSAAAGSRCRRATRCAAVTPPPAWSASSPTPGAATRPARTPTGSARSVRWAAACRLPGRQPAADERRRRGPGATTSASRDEPAQLLQHVHRLPRAASTGGPMDCRGANNQAEFDRQWPKTVAAVAGIERRRHRHQWRSRTTATARQRDPVPRRRAQRRRRRRHLRVHRRRRAHRSGRRPRHRRDQGRHALQAGRRDAGRARRRRSTPWPSSTAATPPRATVPRSRRPSGQRDRRHASSSTSTTSRARAARATRPTPVTARATATRCAPRGAGCWRLAGTATRPAPATPTSCIVGDYNSYAKEDPITTLEDAGLHQPDRAADRRATPTPTSSTASGATSTTPSASRVGPPQVTGVAEWHINADEPSVLDYNTDFKSAGTGRLAVRAGPVPHLRPRPGHRRPGADAGGRVVDHDAHRDAVLAGLRHPDPATLTATVELGRGGEPAGRSGSSGGRRHRDGSGDRRGRHAGPAGRSCRRAFTS